MAYNIDKEKNMDFGYYLNSAGFYDLEGKVRFK